MAYCDRCQRHFPHDFALEQHENDSDAHWLCDSCNRDFTSNYARQQHYMNSSLHHYCGACDRHFQSESNLRHHINSKVHQPANVRCPGRGCIKSFITPAALTLHFESGTCPSGVTRDELNRLVVRADTNNYITNPSRLLTGPLGWNEPPPPATMWATNLSWNGMAFECFLCNGTYGTLMQLNQHLQSPFHLQNIYRCPNLACGVEFSTLSGLCQHVEGGSCGVRQFRQVRNMMEGFSRGSNLLGM